MKRNISVLIACVTTLILWFSALPIEPLIKKAHNDHKIYFNDGCSIMANISKYNTIVDQITKGMPRKKVENLLLKNGMITNIQYLGGTGSQKRTYDLFGFTISIIYWTPPKDEVLLIFNSQKKTE